MASTEVRTLVCKLTEDEKIRYRSEVAELGIAHGEIVEALKAKLQEIKVAKQRQKEILDTLKFNQEEGPDKDDHGRSVLVEIDPARREALETENLDLATQLEELTEQRQTIHNERKTTKDGLTDRLKALKYGQEEREVKCEWRPRFDEQTCRLYRLDTGEAIDSRPLTDEETQQAFQFEVSKPALRVMSQCPICGADVGLTAGRIETHNVGSDVCVAHGLTTQQATALGGRLAEFETLPDAATISGLRFEVATAIYPPGRSTIRSAETVKEEREAADAGEDKEDDPFVDSSADLRSLDDDPLDGGDVPEDDMAWDAAAALPGYLKQLNLGYASDIRPSDVDALMDLAGSHKHDLIAYLLAQPVDLKPTTKRALKAWGKN